MEIHVIVYNSREEDAISFRKTRWMQGMILLTHVGSSGSIRGGEISDQVGEY
jgi:hypothetical protein